MGVKDTLSDLEHASQSFNALEAEITPQIRAYRDVLFKAVDNNFELLGRQAIDSLIDSSETAQSRLSETENKEERETYSTIVEALKTRLSELEKQKQRFNPPPVAEIEGGSQVGGGGELAEAVELQEEASGVSLSL
jgi:hypothetical protein